jgi:hypothetical protein
MVWAKKERIVIGTFVMKSNLTTSGKIVNNNYFIFKSLRKPWCHEATEENKDIMWLVAFASL